MTNEIKYGFYSAAAVKAGTGSSIYEDENGNEVEITCISNDIHGSGYNWPDKRFVGIVVKYLRKEHDSQRMEKGTMIHLPYDGREFYPEADDDS